MRDIQRKSALEVLYMNEENARQARADAARSETEAAKSKTQLHLYKLKAQRYAKDRNHENSIFLKDLPVSDAFVAYTFSRNQQRWTD